MAQSSIVIDQYHSAESRKDVFAEADLFDPSVSFICVPVTGATANTPQTNIDTKDNSAT